MRQMDFYYWIVLEGSFLELHCEFLQDHVRYLLCSFVHMFYLKDKQTVAVQPSPHWSEVFPVFCLSSKLCKDLARPPGLC